MKGTLHERIPELIENVGIVRTNQYFDFLKVHHIAEFEQVQAKFSLWEYQLEKQIESIEKEPLEKTMIDWIHLMFSNQQPLESIISAISNQKEWIIKHELTQVVKKVYRKGKLAYLYKKVS